MNSGKGPHNVLALKTCGRWPKKPRSPLPIGLSKLASVPAGGAVAAPAAGGGGAAGAGAAPAAGKRTPPHS